MSDTLKKFLNPEMMQLMPAFRPFPFEIKSIMESARRNMQACAEAQQMMIEGCQTLAQRQRDMMSQAIEDQMSLMRALMADGTPEEKIARQADMMKKCYEHMAADCREMQEMTSKSTYACCDIMNARVSGTLREVRDTMRAQKAAPKNSANVTSIRKAA